MDLKILCSSGVPKCYNKDHQHDRHRLTAKVFFTFCSIVNRVFKFKIVSFSAKKFSLKRPNQFHETKVMTKAF